MPSLVELAELSRAAYGDSASVSFDHNGKPVTWTRAAKYCSGSFFAAVYAKEGSARVLAYRGTDDLLSGDTVDDAMIARGDVPPTAALAVRLPAVVGTGELMLAGHSLGGAMAILASARYDVPAVTFNAPGVMDSCAMSAAFNLPAQGGLAGWARAVGRCFSGSHMKNIRVQGDPVSNVFITGLQPGSTNTYSAPQCGLRLISCRHGIDTCVQAVRSRSDGFDEVRL